MRVVPGGIASARSGERRSGDRGCLLVFDGRRCGSFARGFRLSVPMERCIGGRFCRAQSRAIGIRPLREGRLFAIPGIVAIDPARFRAGAAVSKRRHPQSAQPLPHNVHSLSSKQRGGCTEDSGSWPHGGGDSRGGAVEGRHAAALYRRLDRRRRSPGRAARPAIAGSRNGGRSLRAFPARSGARPLELQFRKGIDRAWVPGRCFDCGRLWFEQCDSDSAGRLLCQ